MSSSRPGVSMAVAALACAGAAACPPDRPPVTAATGPTWASPSDVGWTDGFDEYAAAGLIGQSTWTPSCLGGQDGMVSAATAFSPPHSLRVHPGTRVVHEFEGITSGQFQFKVKTFVPSNAAGTGTRDAFITLLNSYCPATSGHRSVVLRISAQEGTASTLTNGVYTESLPLIYDQWVCFTARIDLDADTMTQYYGGVTLSAGAYSANIGPGGRARIAAVELSSETLDGIHFDDGALIDLGCYPDCNLCGTLTIADFACFQAQFMNTSAYADCNNDGQWSIADFACFQAAFVKGC